MERAGEAVADLVLAGFPDARRITVVCGSGNNGGDGRVAARCLEQAGREVTVVDVKPEDEEKDLGAPDVVIDAIFGTGFAGEPQAGRGAADRGDRRAGRAGRRRRRAVRGRRVDGRDRRAPRSGRARTVTFHGGKVGLHVAPGRFRAGEIEVVDIGLEPVATAHALVGPEILRLVPLRRAGDTKYTAARCSSSAARPG